MGGAAHFDTFYKAFPPFLQASVTKVQFERPYQMNILMEAMDIIFNKPSSIFLKMTAMDFIFKGIEINCNHTVYAAKVVCAEYRRVKSLKIMNEEKTLLRYRWFDRVRE